MTKYFCDRCRKEVRYAHLTLINIHSDGGGGDSSLGEGTICQECRATIAKIAAEWFRYKMDGLP